MPLERSHDRHSSHFPNQPNFSPSPLPHAGEKEAGRGGA